MREKTYIIPRATITILGVVSIVFIFSYFIKKDLVLDGKLEANSDFNKKNPIISVIYPEHRTELKNEIYQIKEEPVYFNLRSPINFDKAKIEMEFQSGSQDIVYLGLKTNESDWSFDNHMLFNAELNKLNWKFIGDEKYTLWQKNPKYTNIDKFKNEIESLKGVNAIDYNSGDFSKNYIAQDKVTTISNCLRGGHTFFTYIKNEALEFSFKFQDINRTKGLDPIVINIYDKNSKKVYSNVLSDENKNPIEDFGEDPKYASIYLKNLENGVYKIEIIANEDIFIREIKTKQQKLVLSDKIYLCDNREYLKAFPDLKMESSNIFSNAKIISFYTPHPTGLQKVYVNEKLLNINNRHTSFQENVGPKTSHILVSKNNIKISGVGIFALNENQYFDPNFENLRNYTSSQNIEYVISQYKIPEKIKENYLKNIVYFDLKNAKIEEGNLKFIISIPEINEKDYFKIKSIKAYLYKDEKIDENKARKDFYDNIFSKFSSIKEKIISKIK